MIEIETETGVTAIGIHGRGRRWREGGDCRYVIRRWIDDEGDQHVVRRRVCD